MSAKPLSMQLNSHLTKPRAAQPAVDKTSSLPPSSPPTCSPSSPARIPPCSPCSPIHQNRHHRRDRRSGQREAKRDATFMVDALANSTNTAMATDSNALSDWGTGRDAGEVDGVFHEGVDRRPQHSSGRCECCQDELTRTPNENNERTSGTILSGHQAEVHVDDECASRISSVSEDTSYLTTS